MNTHETTCTCNFLHADAGSILCMHSDFQKPKQGKFSTFMLRFGMNPTLFGNHFKPLFSHYKNPYTIYFQSTQKSHGKTKRFTRNSESKREFFKKHPQVNFLLIKAFSGLGL